MSGYLIPTAAGLALGFGLASVAYMGTFIRKLSALLEGFEVLHADNVESAHLLARADASRSDDVRKIADLLAAGDEATAALLVRGDRNRAADVAKTAADLAEADEVVIRKVKPGTP